MKKSLVGLFALTVALCAPAMAQDGIVRPNTETRVPNFLGATGLLATPSAYVQGDQSASVFIAGSDDVFGGGAVVGLGDQFELGVSLFDFDRGTSFARGGNGTEVVVNAKYQLLRETAGFPAFSAGVIDLFDQVSDDVSWYLVASKYFTRAETDQNFALKGHIGYGGGVYDNEIFLGAELLFGRNLSAIGELVDGDFNVGARYNVGPFAATLSWFDLNKIGGSLSYNVRLR